MYILVMQGHVQYSPVSGPEEVQVPGKQSNPHFGSVMFAEDILVIAQTLSLCTRSGNSWGSSFVQSKLVNKE